MNTKTPRMLVFLTLAIAKVANAQVANVPEINRQYVYGRSVTINPSSAARGALTGELLAVNADSLWVLERAGGQVSSRTMCTTRFQNWSH
jgi:hypothetical protein